MRLWYPISWFLLTSAVYYGFGPLLYYYGTVETVQYVHNFYCVDDASLHEATFLNLAGIVCVMGAYLLAKLLGDRRRPVLVRMDPGEPEVQRNLRQVTIAFVAVGIPVKLLLVLPRALGLTDSLLPGGVEFFGVLAMQALVPAFVLYRASKAVYTIPFYALLAFNLAVSFITLSKLKILKVGVALVLAAVLTGTRFRTLLVAGTLGLFVYGAVLTPLVFLSRNLYGVQGLTSLNDAQSAVEGFARSGRDDAADLIPGVQGWWARLNYANAQTFALRAYSDGRSGSTFNLALYAFVPRLLYPAKPIMTSGVEFNVLVTGNASSQSSPGMFAEAYWNGGWLLSMLTFVFLGAFYWAWEVYARSRLAASRLAYVPVTWMGLFTAIQQDSRFSAGTIGTAPIAIVFHYIARWFFERSSGPSRARDSVPVAR